MKKCYYTLNVHSGDVWSYAVPATLTEFRSWVFAIATVEQSCYGNRIRTGIMAKRFIKLKH